MALVLPSHHYMWWDPTVLEMDEHLPVHGKQWINFLLCFVCMHCFCFLYWTVFILTHEFSNFYTLPILSLSLLEGEWAKCCKGLGCWLGLNCNKAIKDWVMSKALYTNTLRLSSCIWADNLRLMHIPDSLNNCALIKQTFQPQATHAIQPDLNDLTVNV